MGTFRVYSRTFDVRLLAGRYARMLSVVGVVVCASDVARGLEPFTEEAMARGINHIATQTSAAGRGLAFVDLDQDGDPDLVVTGKAGGQIGVYENDGSGMFIDRAATSGIPLLVEASGVIAADYDADHDLDLFIPMFDAANRLLRNDGGFVFTDVTAAAGLGDVGRATGCAFGDYDGDGFLDLYVANLTNVLFTVPNVLYRNQGDGTFLPTGLANGPLENELTWQAVFFDFDVDGDADLYLSNDKGQNTGCARFNYLFRNDGGTFSDITDSSGTAACIDSMGVALGDWDQNRYPDIYLTNIPLGNKLFMNNGDETFSSFAAPAGVECYGYGWGTVFLDFDNDRFDDLYVCNQDVGNRLYKFEGTWPCTDVALSAGVFAPGVSFTVASADIDNDGDVDLAVQNNEVPLQLFINHHESTANQWIKFRVVGEGNNYFGIGAVVEVRTGVQWQQRQVLAGSNFKSQNELVQHFGMRTASIVDEIRILWPGGESRTLTNLPVGNTWTLYPPERLGDADGDGIVGPDDGDVLAACVEVVGSNPVTPGCEMMDFDGDGDIDGHDGMQFAAAWDGPGMPPMLPGLTAGVPAASGWFTFNAVMGMAAVASVLSRRRRRPYSA